MKTLSVACLFLGWAFSADGSIVQLDYSLDSGFFAATPAAMAAVNAAALDIGNAITGSLGAVTTNVFSGTNGATTATFTWHFDVNHPSSPGTVTVPPPAFNFAANSLTIYAGMKPLSGTTLGVGGPAGGGISLSGSGFASQWIGAVAAGESSSNATMPRGGGPVIGSLSGSATLGGTTANYNVRYGTMLGSLSMDSDSDNNGSTDTAAQLAAYWHYDHTTPVVAGKNDFYSVALHEILHAIGFGASETWGSLHSGTTWTGANVIALQGTGANTVSADGAHVADGLMSTRISDGAAQEAVMDPSLTVGTRKTLTALDLAFLRDIGFTTVPEPSAGLSCISAGLVLLVVRRRKMAAQFA